MPLVILVRKKDFEYRKNAEFNFVHPQKPASSAREQKMGAALLADPIWRRDMEKPRGYR